MHNGESLIYGQLNKATFTDFVSRLATEQSGDRPHATANPLFSVQNEKIVWSRDDESCHQLSRIFFCTDDYSSFETYDEVLGALTSDRESSEIDMFTNYIDIDGIDTSNQEEVANVINIVFDNDYEACVMYGTYVWEHINTHITPEAAHAFIERKKHDYRKLRVYAVSACWSLEFKAIIDGFVNGSIQYIDNDTNNKIKELERQRYVLQNLLAQFAGQAVDDEDVQEALLFGLGDNAKSEQPLNHRNKQLKWKARESGDDKALMFESELLAIVSYSTRGWYWYSMCDEFKLNTLRTNTTFEDMESAQAHCKQHISAALSTLRGGN